VRDLAQCIKAHKGGADEPGEPMSPSAFTSSAGHDRLPAVLELQNSIAASALSVDAVVSLVAERAADLTGADAGAIAFAEGDDLVYRHASEAAAAHLGLRVPLAGSLSGHAVREEAILRCDDVTEDARADAVAAAQVGAVSVACVPVRRYGRAVGVLLVYAGRRAAFSDADLTVLGFLSGIVGAQMANADEIARREAESRNDVLTGLGNRRAYDERLAREVARSGRHGHALAVVLLDVDGLAEVDAAGGREAGDAALRAVAEVLRGLRRSDECFRIGDDQFAVLLPDTDALGAAFVAERVCTRIAETAGVTTSAGLAEMQSPDPVELHAGADERLSAVKAGVRPTA
jgi:diguanylate cyclase (GGDEF)-like protein